MTKCHIFYVYFKGIHILLPIIAAFPGGSDLNSNEKKLEKKQKILETAYNLFMTKTVGATAVDDVVKAAGIARGTFYLYFKDKYDLMDRIIAHKNNKNRLFIIVNDLGYST